MPTPDTRPRLTPALDALVADLIVQIPALAGLVATDILVVGLGAHAHAAASVRTLDGVARSVLVDDKKRRVELGLRPPFFLVGDAARRTATLVHELLHLDPGKPGALLDAHRHAKTSHEVLEERARTLARHYLDAGAERAACLAHDGEVLLRQWRHRPVESTAADRFSDEDVFDAPVRIVTPKSARAGWW